MLDGFQYLEERDATDNITHTGVVSKKSAFATSDNAGIYDSVAKDLRLLAEEVTSLSDNAAAQSILIQVKNMYDEMKSNPNWGETAARAQAQEAFAQAQEALKQAQAAAASAAAAKDYSDKAASVTPAIATVEGYLKTIDALKKSVADNATVATNKAAAAGTSETNAKASEASAKAWATSTGSPDGAADTDSATGKTQSSRTWALSAKASAETAQSAAAQATSTLKNTAAAVKAAITGSSRIYMWSGGKGYPLASVKDVATNKVYDATYCRLSDTKPTETTDIWLKPVS